jgi:lipid II:glycine glycyltransferase (peptidoglycan interpeptide bridge formation enzyme)
MFQLLDADTVDWDIRAPHPLQTWTWGAIRQAEGKRVARFFDSQTYEQHQMTLHPIPHTSYMIGYIPKSTLPTDAFISFVRSFAQQNNILFIKFEPHVRQDTHLSLHPALTQSTHPLFTTWNQTLALNSPEKKLLSQMHHKTRYNIRLASKKGVHVHIGTSDQDYAVFEKLYFDTCRRQRYHGHTLNYHRAIWKHFLLCTIPCSL